MILSFTCVPFNSRIQTGIQTGGNRDSFNPISTNSFNPSLDRTGLLLWWSVHHRRCLRAVWSCPAGTCGESSESQTVSREVLEHASAHLINTCRLHLYISKRLHSYGMKGGSREVAYQMKSRSACNLTANGRVFLTPISVDLRRW